MSYFSSCILAKKIFSGSNQMLDVENVTKIAEINGIYKNSNLIEVFRKLNN